MREKGITRAVSSGCHRVVSPGFYDVAAPGRHLGTEVVCNDGKGRHSLIKWLKVLTSIPATRQPSLKSEPPAFRAAVLVAPLVALHEPFEI